MSSQQRSPESMFFWVSIIHPMHVAEQRRFLTRVTRFKDLACERTSLLGFIHSMSPKDGSQTTHVEWVQLIPLRKVQCPGRAAVQECTQYTFVCSVTVLLFQILSLSTQHKNCTLICIKFDFYIIHIIVIMLTLIYGVWVNIILTSTPFI